MSLLDWFLRRYSAATFEAAGIITIPQPDLRKRTSTGVVKENGVNRKRFNETVENGYAQDGIAEGRAAIADDLQAREDHPKATAEPKGGVENRPRQEVRVLRGK